jgi:peptidase E
MNMVSKSVSKMQNEYVGKWQEMFEKCSGMAQEIELLTETLREVRKMTCNADYAYTIY